MNKEMTERMQKSTAAGPVGKDAIEASLKTSGLDDMSTSEHDLATLSH